MIAAGVKVFQASLSDRVPDDWVLAPLIVAELYQAMARLRPRDSHKRLSHEAHQSFGSLERTNHD
jgi:hypothetical protein